MGAFPFIKQNFQTSILWIFICILFCLSSVDSFAAQLPTPHREVIIIAPTDAPDGPLTNQHRRDVYAFVSKNFEQEGVYPKDFENQPIPINDLNQFEKVVRERLNVSRVSARNLELTIMFFTHGGLWTADDGQQELILSQSPETDRDIRFRTYLTKIQKVILQTGMRTHVALNISVGSCHSGQCTVDYKRHGIQNEPYDKAVFGFVHPTQTIYSHSFLELWEVARRIDQFFSENDYSILKQKSQFERWSFILSSLPIWVTAYHYGYYTHTQMTGTNLSSAKLTLERLIALGIALPLFEWGYKSYPYLIQELKKRFQRPGARQAFEQILETKFSGLVGSKILKTLINEDHVGVIKAVIEASSTVDAHRKISRYFVGWFLDEYLYRYRYEGLPLPEEILPSLMAQKDLMWKLRRGSDVSWIQESAAKSRTYELPIARHLMLELDASRFKKIFQDAKEKHQEKIFLDAADVELAQAIAYHEQNEACDGRGTRWLFIQMILSREPELIAWVEKNFVQFAMQPSKERDFVKGEMLKSLSYWDDPLYQVVSVRMAEALGALNVEEATEKLATQKQKLSSVANDEKLIHRYIDAPIGAGTNVRSKPNLAESCSLQLTSTTGISSKE